MGESESGAGWKRLKAEIKGLGEGSLGLEALEKLLERVASHLEACPESRALEGFREEVQRDLEGVRELRNLTRRRKKLEDEFQRLREGLRELEAKTSEACGKYFDRQQEYVRVRRGVEKKAEQALMGIQKEFLEKAESITQGYELRAGEEEYTPEKLYAALAEGSLGRVSFSLRPKRKGLIGVLDMKEGKSRAKEEVLEYLVNETARRIEPILLEKEGNLEKARGRFRGLKALEEACREAEKAREAREGRVEELRVEILGIRMSKAYAYSKPEKLMELRAQYLSRLAEVEG